MRVIKRDKNGDDIAEIFIIYWDKEGKTYFLGVSVNANRLFIHSADEVEILDPSINFRTVYLPDKRLSGILHWSLVEKDLLDEFIGGDTEIRKQFLEIVRSENVKDLYLK